MRAEITSAPDAGVPDAGDGLDKTDAPFSDESSYLHLYMGAAPNGSDLTGVVSSMPLQTLDQVQDAIQTYHHADLRHVVVNIEPRTYYNQRVRWVTTFPSRRIIFKPWGTATERPQFVNGESSATPAKQRPMGSFFHLFSRNGEPSNVTLYRLDVRNYSRAVLLDGDPNDVNGFNGNNRFIDNLFVNIGRDHVDDSCEDGQPNCANGRVLWGFSSITARNSRDNLFLRNYISGNEPNPVEDSALPHAIYLAHNASDNRILYNFVAHISGHAIKVRDQSHRNEVNANMFHRAGHKTYLQNYDTATECPSVGMEFLWNYLGVGHGGASLPATETWVYSPTKTELFYHQAPTIVLWQGPAREIQEDCAESPLPVSNRNEVGGNKLAPSWTDLEARWHEVQAKDFSAFLEQA